MRQAVIGEKDAVDTDGKPIYQLLMPQQLVATMWTALRDVIQRVETLEDDVKKLKGS